MRAWVPGSVIAACAWLGLVPLARAEDQPVAAALRVERPAAETCLAGDALAPLVIAWLGRGGIDASLGVVVRVDGDGVRFAVTRLGAVVAERRFAHLPGRCEDRRAAVSLAIALAIDATTAATWGLEAEVPPAPASPGAEVVGAAPTAPGPATGGRPRWRLRAELAGVALVGVLPERVPGARAAVAFVSPQRRELRVTLLGSGTSNSPLGSGRAQATFAGGRVDGCLAARGVLAACAGVVGGRVPAAGRDFERVQSSATPYLAVGGGLEGRLALGRGLGLSLAVDAWLPLLRPRLEVMDPQGRVIVADLLPGLGLAVAAGVTLELP